MPTRRKYRNKRKAPRRRKRKKTYNKLDLFKNRQRSTLRYVDIVTVDCGATLTPTSAVIHANGIYDPIHAATSARNAQPMGRDEIAALFGHYQVTSSTIKVTPIATSTASTGPALWGVITDPLDYMNYTSAMHIIEDKKVRGAGPVLSYGSPHHLGDKGARPLKASFSTRMMGAQSRNATFGSNADPVAGPDDWFYHVWTASPDGSNDPGPLKFLVEIVYNVTWTLPHTPTQS